MTHSEVVRELLLECLDLGAEDVHAPLDDAGDPFHDLLAERLQRGVGVEQRDRHEGERYRPRFGPRRPAPPAPPRKSP